VRDWISLVSLENTITSTNNAQSNRWDTHIKRGIGKCVQNKSGDVKGKDDMRGLGVGKR